MLQNSKAGNNMLLSSEKICVLYAVSDTKNHICQSGVSKVTDFE